MTPDPLRRGWRPPALGHRRRAGIALLVGFALVLTPFWAGPVAAGLTPQGTYQYEAVPIEPANDSFVIDGADRGLHTHGIWGVDCYVHETDGPCLYAWGLRNATVTIPDAWLSDRPGLVHLDRFYDPVVVETDAGTRFGLEPVSAASVLANVSQDPGGAGTEAETVLDTGTLSSTERITGEGFVFDTDDGYRLVALVGYDGASHDVALPPLYLVEFGGVLAGLGLLRIGQRNYDRWREQPSN